MKYQVSDLIESLRSHRCPACGRGKRPKQTLCGHDYASLPRVAKQALYQTLGRGYEHAFSNAMNLLGVKDPHWPEKQQEESQNG